MKKWFMIFMSCFLLAASLSSEAQLAPNLRRAVVLEAYHALRPAADGSCDRTINGNCVSSWNYLNDDYWAYDRLKSWYTCNSSIWFKSANNFNGVYCGSSTKPYSYYSEMHLYGLNNYNAPGRNYFGASYGRGGQCKHFANLITYRSGADPNQQATYTTMTGSSFRIDTQTNLGRVREGDVIFSPNVHTAIVVGIVRSGTSITGLTLVDSNYVGGRDNEIIGKHVMSSTELSGNGYRVWTGTSYYNTTYDPNSHW
jgi:hypothetical protein